MAAEEERLASNEALIDLIWQYLPSVLITVMYAIFPILFKMLAKLERYYPATEQNVTIARWACTAVQSMINLDQFALLWFQGYWELYGQYHIPFTLFRNNVIEVLFMFTIMFVVKIVLDVQMMLITARLCQTSCCMFDLMHALMVFLRCSVKRTVIYTH